MKKFIRHVPLDEEGYTQAFNPDQETECAHATIPWPASQSSSSVLDFLHEYGFVVIRCLSQAECTATVADLFADVNAQAAATQKQKIFYVRSYRADSHVISHRPPISVTVNR